MKVLIALLLGVAMVASFVGCEIQFEGNEESAQDMGTHHVVVKPGSTFTSWSSSSGGTTETYRFSSGEISVTIQNEQLTVNNVDYGQLETGEAVSIDNGKVFVADKERQGTPLSDEEVLAAAPVKKSTEELAGYNVTVRPGASFVSTTMLFGKHTLTVGETNVVIKSDELFVNDISYGKLNEGDTILVESMKVSVSGKDREPQE